MKKNILITLLTLGFFLLFNGNTKSQNWIPSDTNWYVTSVNWANPKNFIDNDISTFSWVDRLTTGTMILEFDEYKMIDYLAVFTGVTPMGAHGNLEFYYEDENNDWILFYVQYCGAYDTIEVGVYYKKLKLVCITDGGQYPVYPYELTFSEDTDWAPYFITHPEDVFTCIGGGSATFQVEATGGVEPYDYQWYKNDVLIPGATSDVYTINSTHLSDTGFYNCVVSNQYGGDTSEYAELTLLEPSEIFGPLVVEVGEITDYFNSINEGSTYQWEISGGDIIAVEEGHIIVQWLEFGTGILTLHETTSFGCVCDPIYLYVGVGVVGINDNKNAEIKVYPNPATDIINIEKMGKNDIYIYSVDGRLIKSEKFTNKISINVSDLPSGLYIYKMNDMIGKFYKK